MSHAAVYDDHTEAEARTALLRQWGIDRTKPDARTPPPAAEEPLLRLYKNLTSEHPRRQRRIASWFMSRTRFCRLASRPPPGWSPMSVSLRTTASPPLRRESSTRTRGRRSSNAIAPRCGAKSPISPTNSSAIVRHAASETLRNCRPGSYSENPVRRRSAKPRARRPGHDRRPRSCA
jgi:hypothetical protein